VPRDFKLRVPRDTAAIGEELLAAIEPSARFAAQRPDREHRVRRGDTLSGIASEYRVSLAALMRVNGLGRRDIIRVGQLIKLPTDAAASDAIVTLASAEPAPTQAAPTQPDDAASSGVYVVRNGDSIERIANRLGVDQRALLAANAIRNKNLIYAGQQLLVPGINASDAAGNELAETESEAAAAEGGETLATGEVEVALAPAVLANGEPSDAESGELGDAAGIINALATEQADLAADPTDYSVSAANQITVQAVETLGHYADWLGIPTQRLRDLNGLSFEQSVVIGQKLTLDLADTDADTFERRRVAYHQQLQSDFFATHQIEDIEDHIVKPRESLWVLAARTYKVPVWLLRQYNPDIDLDRVRPGTVVKFPRLKVVAPSGDSPAPETIAAAVP